MRNIFLQCGTFRRKLKGKTEIRHFTKKNLENRNEYEK